MNNVAQYVSHGYAGRDNGSHIGYSGGSTDDSNADDDSENDNSNKDDDDAGDSFWHIEFDRHKLVLCIAGTLALYFNNYIYKQPCMISYNTGM
jgi:hypothetical protein